MPTQLDPDAGPPSDPSSLLRQCESLEECQALYASIPAEKKAPALEHLRNRLSGQEEDLRARHAADPKTWWAAGHFGWGMRVRNWLREAGFGEDYFHIVNLDDIYVQAVEEALDLHTGRAS